MTFLLYFLQYGYTVCKVLINGDEYILMGLSAYGKPKLKKEVLKLIKFNPPFDFKLNLKYFNHHTFNDFFEEVQGVPYFDNLFSNEIK